MVLNHALHNLVPRSRRHRIKDLLEASNLDQLFDFVKEEWEKLPKDFFQKLVDSMPRRIRAVIRNHGGSTSY